MKFSKPSTMKYSLRSLMIVVTLACVLSVAQGEDATTKNAFTVSESLLRVCPERTSQLIIAPFDQRIERKEGGPVLIGRLPLWLYGEDWDGFIENCLRANNGGMTVSLSSPVTDKSAIQCQLLYPVKRDKLAAAVRTIREGGQENAKVLGETTLGTRVVHHLRFDDAGRPKEAFACSLTDDCAGIVKDMESLQVLLKEIDSKDKKPAPILSLTAEVRQRLNGKACVIRWFNDGEDGILREYATITQDEVLIYREHPAKEIAGKAWEAEKFRSLPIVPTIKPVLAKVDDRTIRYTFPISPGDDGGQLIWGFCLWVRPELIGGLGR
jgi:hypothetical protein